MLIDHIKRDEGLSWNHCLGISYRWKSEPDNGQVDALKKGRMKDKFKKKPKCIVYGNCVAEAVVRILKEQIQFFKSFDIIYIRSVRHPIEGAAQFPLEKIRNCSLFQRGHLQFPEFSDELPSTCRTISFPVLELRSLWPFERGIQETNLNPKMALFLEDIPMAIPRL